MRKLRILSPRFMYPEQIRILKAKRKKFMRHSVTDFNGNFIEHKKFGNGVWINPKPGEDSIFDFFHDFEKSGKPEYDFNKLPRPIQNYILKIDEELFQAEYRNHVNRVDNAIRRMDYKIESMEKRLDRKLTDEEFWLLMSEMPIRYEDTTFKKCRRSVSRAYNMIVGYSRCNMHAFKYFVTLTFAPSENRLEHEEKGLTFKYCESPTDYKSAYGALDTWLETMKKQKQRRGFEFEYLMTYEKQENGNYHFHALMSDIPDDLIIDTPEPLDFYKGRKMFGKSIKNWKYGKSDIQEIRDKEKITTYISKYIVKTLRNMVESDYYDFLNQNKYYVSRGLVKPDIEYYESLGRDFDEEKELTYSDKHDSSYRNPYDKTDTLKTVYSKKNDEDSKRANLM